MSDLSTSIRWSVNYPDCPAGVAALLQGYLGEALGPTCAPVSLALDFGSPLKAGEPSVVEYSLDRQTRTLVFAQVRFTDLSGTFLATASGVFRRISLTEGASVEAR